MEKVVRYILSAAVTRVVALVETSAEFLRELAAQVADRIGLDEIAARVADGIDTDDLASEIAGGVDWEDYVNLDDILSEIEIDHAEIASEIDISDVASEIDLDDLATAFISDRGLESAVLDETVKALLRLVRDSIPDDE